MTRYKALTLLFAATLFSSAFLIFSIQPIIGKMVLPLLGGVPSVWNTAMLFFQAMLLAGYSYAHLTARYLSLRMQAMVHIGLLAVCILALPIGLPENVMPPSEGNMQWWQIGLMAGMVGGPFFVLAASAPLFQHWFSASEHPDAENPYFLYAVSNAGSMLALLSYPFIIEPLFTIPQQSLGWSLGYLVLLSLVYGCAMLIWNGRKPAVPFADVKEAKDASLWRKRGAWIALAFIPSSLMLGLTTYISTDLAAIPLFWIIPLALYLLTFIIAFGKSRDEKPKVLRYATVAALIALSLVLAHDSYKVPPVAFIAVHILGFALCAQYCHSHLAYLRPAPARLTEFYLLISLGGVLGGAFNAILAPLIFTVPIEYPLVLAAIGFVMWFTAEKSSSMSLKFNTIDDKARKIKLLVLDALMLCVGVGIVYLAMNTNKTDLLLICLLGATLILGLTAFKNPPVFALYCAFILISFQYYTTWNQHLVLREERRNYFGLLRVYDYANGRSLVHGTTTHGMQYTDERRRLTPTTYYSPIGPAADIFYTMNHKELPAGGQKMAALGLGVGSVNCYMRYARTYDFYEIDSDIAEIAQDPKYFTYLKDCSKDYRIILGDARLKMAQAPDSYYDLIFIDTFSSDSIPIHIITREAFEMYLRKLKPGGLIAVHITNRYFDLRIPIHAIVEDLGLKAVAKFHSPYRRPGSYDSATSYIVISRDEEDLMRLIEKEEWQPLTAARKVRPWTDDYANIFPAFYFLNRN